MGCVVRKRARAFGFDVVDFWRGLYRLRLYALGGAPLRMFREKPINDYSRRKVDWWLTTV